MSRFRPPSEKGSPYITAEGYEILRAEYDELWRHRRPAVVRALAEAAAEGDRSENAEYQYRKKELREIDRRVRYLQVRIPELKVVRPPPREGGKVFFGACVRVVDSQGDEAGYRIVGPDEADGGQGSISVDSPLARALLQREAGDIVKLMLPAGERELEILRVWCP